MPTDLTDQLERVYRDNVRRLYSFARNRVGPDEAAEVVAEVFHAAAVAYRRGHAETVTPAWLTAVARNKCNDHWRRAYRRKARAHLVGLRREDVVEFPEGWTADPRRERVLATLDALPERDRSLLILHYVDGMPAADLAESIGKSRSATESALARARRKFEKAYDRAGDDARR